MNKKDFEKLHPTCTLLSDNVMIGRGVMIGDNARLGRGATLGDNVTSSLSLSDVYLYACTPQITADGVKSVQMGCHLRTLEEWQNDFWNNPREFPDEGSPLSVARKLAFDMAALWLDAQ